MKHAVFLLCLSLLARTLDAFQWADRTRQESFNTGHDGFGDFHHRKFNDEDGSGRDELGSGQTDWEGDNFEPETGSADIELTPCQMLYNERQRDHIVGGYVPQCTSDGQFAPRQCHAGTGQCWCVDMHGRQLPNSMGAAAEVPDCTNYGRVFTRRPNYDQTRTFPTRVPVSDNGILIDHKTGPSSGPGSAVDVELRDEEDDGDDSGGKVLALPSHGILNHPGILAAMIAVVVIILLCALLLIMFIVYRVRKKDEGSYALEEPKKKLTPSRGNPTRSGNVEYTRAPPSYSEFFA